MKKSQIFIFDIILAFIIILVGISVFFLYDFYEFDNQQLYSINKNILKGISMTQINSLNDDEIRVFFSQNKIKNIKNTVAEQIVEFCYEDEIELAQNLTKIFVKNYVNNQLNINITLENSSFVQTLYVLKVNDVSFKDSYVSSQTSKNFFSFLNSKEVFGPYQIKIKIWQ